MGISFSCCEEKDSVCNDLMGAQYNQTDNLNIDKQSTTVSTPRRADEANSHYAMNSMLM